MSPQPIYVVIETKDNFPIVITFSNYINRRNGYGIKYITSGTEYELLQKHANQLTINQLLNK